MQMMQAFSTYLPPNAFEEDASASPFEDSPISSEHCYSLNINPLLGNISVYISSWVVRKVLRKLSCSSCRISLASTMLSSKYESYCMLLRLKNKGGLMLPSDGTISVVLAAESFMRSVSSPLDTVQLKVLQEIGLKDIFGLGQHILDTAVGIDNHHTSLVRLVVEAFYDLRQHHRAKLHNMQLHEQCIRHRNTKAVLFRGQ